MLDSQVIRRNERSLQVYYSMGTNVNFGILKWLVKPSSILRPHISLPQRWLRPTFPRGGFYYGFEPQLDGLVWLSHSFLSS